MEDQELQKALVKMCRLFLSVSAIPVGEAVWPRWYAGMSGDFEGSRFPNGGRKLRHQKYLDAMGMHMPLLTELKNLFSGCNYKKVAPTALLDLCLQFDFNWRLALRLQPDKGLDGLTIAG